MCMLMEICTCRCMSYHRMIFTTLSIAYPCICIAFIHIPCVYFRSVSHVQGYEAISSLCHAIGSNRETRLQKFILRNNPIGNAGASAIADMIR